MTLATQGAGTQFLLPQLGIHTVAAESALGAAINAGVSTLASRATISLINNKGDIGKVFKELGSSQFVKSLATSMLTAGLTAGLPSDILPLQTAGLSANALPFAVRLQNNLVNSLISTSVETAIQGGSFGDNLVNSLRNVGVNQLLAATDKYVGDITDGANKLPVANLIAHTVVGGLAAEATGGKFVTGAAAGLASAIAAQSGVFKGLSPTDIAKVSQLIGGAAALLAGGDGRDVNQGAATSQSAAINNYLTHAQLEEAMSAQRKLLSCELAIFNHCSNQQIAELRNKIEEYKLLSASQTAALLLECGAGGAGCAKMLDDAEKFSAQVSRDRIARGGIGFAGAAAPGADDFYISAGDVTGLSTPVDLDVLAIRYFRQALDKNSNVSFAQAGQLVQDAVLRTDSNIKLFAGGLQIVGGIAVAGTCSATSGLTCLALGILGGSNVVLGGNRAQQGVAQYLSNEAQKSGVEKALINLGYSADDAKRYLANSELLVGIADLATTGALIVTGPSGIRASVSRSGNVEFGSDFSVISADKAGIKFGGGIQEQGVPFEGVVTSKLKAASSDVIDLNALSGGKNFKTFDQWVPSNGTAVSSKTLDTAAKTYAENPSKITSTINGYIDDVVNFEIGRASGFVLRSEQINSRVLEIGIRDTSSVAQWAAVQKSLDYAKTKGIPLVVTKVR